MNGGNLRGSFRHSFDPLVIYRLADGVFVDEVPVEGYAHTRTFLNLNLALGVDRVEHVAVTVEIDGRVRRVKLWMDEA